MERFNVVHYTGPSPIATQQPPKTFSFVHYWHKITIIQGVPKKMVIRKGFELLTLGGVFLGVKNNSKNFGNKKI